MTEDFEDAVYEASGWDMYRLCRNIRDTSNNIERTGYMKVLKMRCEDMDDSDLIRLYEELYRDENGFALKPVATAMCHKNLLYKDDEGYYHKNY